MNQHFEQEKNRKAALYTLIAVIVVVAILLIRITLPVIQEPVVDNGIEVNLGNSDFGSGNVPPMVPGEPAPESTPQQQAAAPPAASPKVDNQEEEPDPNDKEPAITKAVEKPKPTVKPYKNPPIEKAVVVKETPAPPQPKPKAQMGQNSGGKGPGGNNQETANNSKSQGDDQFGKGDKGKPNGNINSDNYKGNGGTGTGGVTVVRGNRAVVRATRLQGDFTQSATLVIQVRVDPGGTGTFMSVVSGMNQSQYTNIIKQRLASRDIQFSSSDDESIVNIQVSFKVN